MMLYHPHFGCSLFVFFISSSMMQRVVLCLLFLAAVISCQVIELRQQDFDAGTYIMNQSAEYKLMQDIVFNPNSVSDLGLTSYESGDVLPTQFTFAGGKYDPAAYGIGFFAAVAISATDATFDLNGFTISQSPEHALQQRFFAVIELADRPFIPNQGPHDFGQTTVQSAHNVIIKNGVIGLSSHHGIHGNLCTDITIQDIIIKDYEVAAIAINGATGLDIKRVTTEGSRTDVPILGVFSAGRFIRAYVNYLLSIDFSGTLRVGVQELTINDIYSSLRTSLNNVFEDVIEERNGGRNGKISKAQHPEEYSLYHNVDGVVDGNAYGILLNQPGVAVNGFPTIPEDPAAMVHLSDIEIRNHVANINEVLALIGTGGKAVIDPVGAAFQVFNTDPDDDDYITISSSNFNDAEYVGNVVSNAQAFVAKAAAAGAFNSSPLDVSRVNINSDLLAWIEATSGSTSKLQNYLDNYGIICNGDSMVHADKGVIGFKLDAANQVLVENVLVKNLKNLGTLGSTLCGYDTDEISNPVSELPGYQGANSRGFSISGSVNVQILNSKVSGIEAVAGSAYGIDVLLDSHDIHIEDCEIDEIHASTSHSSLNDYKGPNPDPVAIGVHAASTSSRVIVSSIKSDNDFSNAKNGVIDLIMNQSSQGHNYYSSSDSSSNKSSSSDASNLYISLASLIALVLVMC